MCLPFYVKYTTYSTSSSLKQNVLVNRHVLVAGSVRKILVVLVTAWNSFQTEVFTLLVFSSLDSIFVFPQQPNFRKCDSILTLNAILWCCEIVYFL